MSAIGQKRSTLSQLFYQGIGGSRCIADQRRLQSGSNENTSHGLPSGGKYQLGTRSFELVDERRQRMRGGAVDRDYATSGLRPGCCSKNASFSTHPSSPNTCPADLTIR